MSRIQDILDKAEREGATLRMHDVDADAPAPPRSAAALASPIARSGATFARAATLDAVELEPRREPPGEIGGSITGTVLDPRLITAASANRTAIEQYRALRTRIANAVPGAPFGILLITSAGRDEGKTLTVGNLGLSMASEGHRRVCLVDANLRNPQLHRLFGLPDGPGLCDVLVGRASLDEALVTLDDHRITILPAGRVPAHPAELLGTTTMRRSLDALRAPFDRILVDAPQVLPLADVGILSPFVDKVLLIVRTGVTTKPAIHDAVASLDSSKLLGVVLNEAA